MGVSPSGAVDWLAARAANRLVGNPDTHAVIETTLMGVTLTVLRPLLVAVTGAEAAVTSGGRPRTGWRSWRCREGDVLEIGAARNGVRSYVAIEGGVVVDEVMGSAATDVVGGFGGRVLAAGDRLHARVAPAEPARSPRFYPDDALPAYARPVTLRALPGPHAALAGEAAGAMFGAQYRVGARSSRQAVRLEGPAIATERAREVVSIGVCAGCVQIAGDGQPTVLLAEHQTTGGYPVILCVIAADQPLIAQARPGDCVRFEPATMQVATHAFALRARQLASLEEVGGTATPDAARLAEGFYEGASS